MFTGLNDAPKVPFQNKPTVDPNTIDEYDKQMFNYLKNLYIAINGEQMDLERIKTSIDALSVFNEKEKINYLDNLLHPEKAKGCKTPSSIPVPSAAFQLHNTVTLNTNSNGNLAVIFNPYFLYNKDSIKDLTIKDNPLITDADFRCDGLSTMWYNNSETLTGQAPDMNWTPVNISQGIPPVYSQFRVVSAAVVVKYIGRMDIASGVIGGAIVFDDNRNIGCINPQLIYDGGDKPLQNLNAPLWKYGNFDLAMDSFYHQENISVEGIREIYFPMDNSYDEYVGLYNLSNYKTLACDNVMYKCRYEADADDYKSGFNFFFYTLGAPSSFCFKFDIYVNFECLPDAQFLNYMPVSMPCNSLSSYEKAQYIRYVQNKPISKSNEVVITPSGQSFWDKLKSKFGKFIPGINMLIQSGILDNIPMLKPALSIAGSLFGNEQPPTLTPNP